MEREQNVVDLVLSQRWDDARAFFSAHPEEAQVMSDPDPSRQSTRLHWLCSIGAVPSSLIDLVASLYPQAITMQENRYGDTPLHVACRNAQVTSAKTIYLLNRLQEYQRHKGREKEKTTSSSLMDCVLIRNRFGGTPLHSACNHNAVLNVIEALVNVNPKVLSVATFDGIYPVSALYTAYIQTIPGYMAVACRLKGEDVSDQSHFGRFWNKVVFLTTADRSASARVPDPSRLVLHGLLRSGHLLVNFYKLALKHDPDLATIADEDGNTAVHLLVERRPFRLKEREAIEATLQAYAEAAAKRNDAGDLPLIIAIRNKIPWKNGVDLLVKAAPTTVQCRDVDTQLLPFQLAASVGGKVLAALDTTFELLCIQPDLLLFDLASATGSSFAAAPSSPPKTPI